jgi:NAD(P)-dependent dehydrogenase (short-subunit alcohol dehydrogenase family)
MNVAGSIALVTGANRGLGRAYVEALLAAGAAKIYAGARDPSSVTDKRLTPVKLDVTAPTDIAAAVARCADVTLLVNNAGAMLNTAMLQKDSDTAMRREMEVNVYGMLAMIRGFAPVLARNGGGAILNMLSVVSWFTAPFNATYGASKHAALAVSDAARIELAGQGTQVVGVYAGYIDTDMAAGIDRPKSSPQEVASRAVAGLVAGERHVLADDSAVRTWQAVRADPAAIEAAMQQAWDQRDRQPGVPRRQP